MKIIPLIITASLAGFLNGFIGTGGGTVLFFAIPFFSGQSANSKTKYVSTIAAVAAMSLVSVFVYSKNGAVSSFPPMRYVIPAILGGAFGGILRSKLKNQCLDSIFAVILIISGVIMLWVG